MLPFKNLSLILFACSITLFSACKDDDQVETEQEAQISLANNASFDNYLVDENGKALYILSTDVKGESTCTEGCTTNWPVFSTEIERVGTGLELSDFETITRADGSQQTTYKGWPLYYYSNDNSESDTNGDNVGEVWFIAKSDYSVMLGDQVVTVFGDTLTKYITDPYGKTLYYYTEDDTVNFVSKCTDGCTEVWPIQEGFDNLILPTALDLDLFDVIARESGEAQLAYRSRPMYFYTQDQLRGEIKGHNVVQDQTSTKDFKFVLSRLHW